MAAGTQGSWLISSKQAAHQAVVHNALVEIFQAARSAAQQATALNTQKQAYNVMLTFVVSFYLTTTNKSKLCVREEWHTTYKVAAVRLVLACLTGLALLSKPKCIL